jgi:hypothetical protein
MSRGKSAEKKNARVAAGPEGPGFARSLGENTGRILRPLFPLVAIMAVLAAGSYLLWRPIHAEGTSASGQAPRGRLSARTLKLAVLSKPRPAWISREDFEQTAQLGLIAENHTIFEANLSRRLAAADESSPWVERVSAVRLRYPAQLELELEWRKPVARVDRTMVLDRNGVVLNLSWDSPNVADTPAIMGVTCGRTEIGKQVPEKELIEGLALLSVVKHALQLSPGNLKVATLWREPAGTWRVVTDRGPYVQWGMFTDDPPMDEPRTKEKADLLRRRLCEARDPSLLEYIRVYHAQAPVKPRMQPATPAGPANPGGPTSAPAPSRTRASR